MLEGPLINLTTSQYTEDEDPALAEEAWNNRTDTGPTKGEYREALKTVVKSGHTEFCSIDVMNKKSCDCGADEAYELIERGSK